MRVKRGLLVGLAMAVAGVAVAVGVARSAGTRHYGAYPSGCPRHPSGYITGSSGDGFVAASRAVHLQIPRVFKNLTSMGHPGWTRASIEALVSTGGTSYNPSHWPRPLGGVARYATIATNTCGKAVEQNSFVAFLSFPDCQLTCGSGFAYVTHTRRGWVLWTSYPD